MKEQLKKAEERMNRRLDHLCTEYAEIRAGRANPAVLDQVKVDYYGARGTLLSSDRSKRLSRSPISASIR